MFFFKQKTAYEMRISDWSSDVCSSDLTVADLIFFSVVGDGVCNPTVAHQIAVPDAISLVDARLVLAKEFGRPFPILPPPGRWDFFEDRLRRRSEEHTSELQSLMRISYAVFCLKKKQQQLHSHLLTLIQVRDI